jgi:hypothetical protein
MTNIFHEFSFFTNELNFINIFGLLINIICFAIVRFHGYLIQNRRINFNESNLLPVYRINRLYNSYTPQNINMKRSPPLNRKTKPNAFNF